jgi:hypothetical protein
MFSLLKEPQPKPIFHEPLSTPNESRGRVASQVTAASEQKLDLNNFTSTNEDGPRSQSAIRVAKLL